jgi:subtilisin family serine protease
MKRFLPVMLIIMLLMSIAPVSAAPDPTIGINVVLRAPADEAILKDLGKFGKVLDVLPSIDAVTMRAKESELVNLRRQWYVRAANPDAERHTGPVSAMEVESFAGGLSLWNLDAINVTDVGFGDRVVPETGAGVYVAVLDTGLVNDWQAYFYPERIATEYAISFGGGGGEKGNVSTQPGKWGRDTSSHGTHVTSTILGFNLVGNPVNGVAPEATVIPVKVLNQNGSGWSSMVAAGIIYVADLKAKGELGDHPVVINMSLSGPELDALEKAAIDYALSQGVIIVASAGNNGEKGMGYPGAYSPVISVAAAGWGGEWVAVPPAPLPSSWWFAADVAEPTNPDELYITTFSSRELPPDQFLDVAAPGSWILGPYQVNMGQLSYYYLGGTSMASPHVAGLVALMLEKDPTITAPTAQAILQATATPIPAPACLDVAVEGHICWEPNATGSGLVNAEAALAHHLLND